MASVASKLGSDPSPSHGAEFIYTTVDVAAPAAAVQLTLFIHAYVGPAAPSGSVFVDRDGLRNELNFEIASCSLIMPALGKRTNPDERMLRMIKSEWYLSTSSTRPVRVGESTLCCRY